MNIRTEISTKIHSFSFTKMHRKISCAKRWSFCPGGYVIGPTHRALLVVKPDVDVTVVSLGDAAGKLLGVDVNAGGVCHYSVSLAHHMSCRKRKGITVTSQERHCVSNHQHSLFSATFFYTTNRTTQPRVTKTLLWESTGPLTKGK